MRHPVDSAFIAFGMMAQFRDLSPLTKIYLFDLYIFHDSILILCVCATVCIRKKSTKPLPDILRHIGVSEGSNKNKGLLAVPKF